MNGRKHFVMIAAAACLSVLGAASAAANDADRTGERGGYVLPGNTDGVNPALHPDLFGTPSNPSCVARFRTYDAATGTYLGNDGRRHPCKS
jgi:hypothetical protein